MCDEPVYIALAHNSTKCLHEQSMPKCSQLATINGFDCEEIDDINNFFYNQSITLITLITNYTEGM